MAAADESPKSVDATVQMECDWILVPLSEIQKLLPSQLTSAGDAAPVRKAIEPLLSAGTARRLDFSSVKIGNGQTGKVGTQRELSAPNDWRAEPNAEGGFKLVPSQSGIRMLGTEIEGQVAVAPDNLSADVQISIRRTERVADRVWREGANEIRLPVLSWFVLEGATLHLPDGQWTLPVCTPWFTAPDKELPLE